MAWSTLPTYTDGSALTAAQLEAIKANILETAVAKAANAGGYFVATGTNALVQRRIASNEDTSTGTTGSASYVNLGGTSVGPTATTTTGATVIVFTSTQLENSAGGSNWASFELTGATTDAAIDNRAIMAQAGAANGGRCGVTTYMTVTAGSNDFRMKYRVSSGTGSFDDRRIVVMSL